MSQKPKRGFSLNETQLGYAMVLPSLLLIFAVVLWPVASSFYNSLFDYRLNDPTRSQKMLTSNIDLESYVDNYYYLNRAMDELTQQPGDPDHRPVLDEVSASLVQFHEELLSESNVQQRYGQVEEKLMSYQPVRDSDLRYAKIDNGFADRYSEFLGESSETIHQLAADMDGDLVSVYENTSSYMAGVELSILESNFIGISHYQSYLQDSRMWLAMWNTVIFTAASVFFELILGLAIALIINRAFVGRGLIRAAVLIPWAIPTAVAAMMWRYLYDGQTGVVAHYFEMFGFISDSSALLSTGAGAMFSVILADVWKTTPYMALLLLAGLQTIPGSLYEAAEVDGANKVQQFFKVTLPLLKSAILVALLFRTLDAFRVFDLIYVLTGGGPANQTESISIYAYKTLFAQQNFGAGSALSVLVFIAVAILSVVFIKLIGSELFAGRNKR